MIRTFTFIAGPLVLVSYGLALSKMDDKAGSVGRNTRIHGSPTSFRLCSCDSNRVP